MENQASKRKELKYVFELKDYTVFKRIIMENGYRKNHSKNFVNNLYFDKDLSSFNENIEGISERTKYRFRWYDKQEIFLEEKIKKAGIGFKNRRPTGFHRIEDIDLSIYKKLKGLNPVVQNRYLREYFINLKGIRITLDSIIKFKQPNSLRVVNSNLNIMEIKYSIENQPDKKLLNSLNLKLTKYSKYVNGYELICNKYDITKR